MRAPLIVALGVLAASPAASVDRPSADDRLAKALAGMTPGSPVSCLERRRETGYRAIGDALVFRYGSKLAYVNRTRGGCNGVGPNEAVVIQAGISRLCTGDLARIVDPRTGMESGSCTLGEFVPYRK
ncbi:hypothetical protein [Sphingomonas sp.]|uniref:hypothetical protein n=1 Tax=Sphingomonas sp. TaxID=28214 RepID=UPI0035C7A00F